MATANPVRIAREAGIGYWMRRVLAERKKVEADFAPDPVHDFRVALRRCRAIAEGMREIDPHPDWRKMRAAGKAVFAAFGELRDVQVLLEWLERLGSVNPPLAGKLIVYCQAREQELKGKAEIALRSFDDGAWLRWAELLQSRAAQFPPGSPLFQVLALQRWQAARQLHAEALRNRSRTGFHQLRIGIKRFRYIVENFLPRQHPLWSADLKRLQDILGELHDLDVLWQTSCAQKAFSTPDERTQWRAALDRERAQRIQAYRERTLGLTSLWRQWRAGLPSGEDLRRAVLERFSVWSSLLGAGKGRTGRLLKFSLSIHDALERSHLPPVSALDGVAGRDLLVVAARLHAVRHHKRARRLMMKMAPPPGWTVAHMQVLAVVARYGERSLPAQADHPYRALSRDGRRLADCLLSILHLAEAFSTEPTITRLRVKSLPDRIAIQASGYRPRSEAAGKIAAARHLLETVTGLPVVVTPEG